MNIAFFSESNFEGNMSRNFDNMRTEYAWYVALNSTHHHVGQLHTLQDKQHDLGIVIIPKMNIKQLMQYPMVEQMKRVCKKIGFMQEGPHWYFQDYPMEQQIWFYNTLMEMDVIFAHNEADVKYFKGLTGKPCYKNPSLMITDNVKTKEKEDKVIIGGNMCRWYGGFDSYIVAQEFDLPIYAPSMGRKIDREDEMGITHLPYVNWLDWQTELSSFRYAVHLMPTQAAGTFAMNCAYLEIPCIGYEGLDTQEDLHPKLTVKFGDLEKAKELARQLKSDERFYRQCSENGRLYYDLKYSEKEYKKYMEGILNETN